MCEQLLANPLVVEARDGLNNQAAGVTVDWQSLVGGGTPSAGSTVTGANGRAQVTYTLGTVALPNLVRASVRGGPKALLLPNCMGHGPLGAASATQSTANRCPAMTTLPSRTTGRGRIGSGRGGGIGDSNRA